jgi:putative ABC transport system ATP-binding protein
MVRVDVTGKSNSLIQVRGLSKAYRRGGEEIQVLQSLNLDVDKGDFVAFMGPSGSGKTTLLNLLGGLDVPSHGSITVAGDEITHMSGNKLTQWRARHVGFIFQFYNLLPTLSAERNVELPLLLTSLSGAERRRKVAAALQLVGLADRAKHKPGELSGGQQQRIAIARALIADPTILICDEPTGDLDRHTAEEILGLLQTLNRQYGKTIIMVTHDPKAASYASRQLQVDKGQLVDGSAQAVA